MRYATVQFRKKGLSPKCQIKLSRIEKLKLMCHFSSVLELVSFFFLLRQIRRWRCRIHPPDKFLDNVCYLRPDKTSQRGYCTQSCLVITVDIHVDVDVVVTRRRSSCWPLRRTAHRAILNGGKLTTPSMTSSLLITCSLTSTTPQSTTTQAASLWPNMALGSPSAIRYNVDHRGTRRHYKTGSMGVSHILPFVTRSLTSFSKWDNFCDFQDRVFILTFYYYTSE